MKRKVNASEEMKLKASRSPNGKYEIYSFFPIDKGNCECKGMISDWKEKLALLSEGGRREAVARQKTLVCPRDKNGMNRYEIVCKNCNEILGYCWAKDKTLTDWCDFHYTSWTDGEQWYGCLTPHVSPITEQLCLECTCGEDTRDFRANMTLPARKAYDIEEKNKIGREFDKVDSKFKVSKVEDNVIPFKEGGN